MRAINLLPRDLEAERKKAPIPLIVGCASMVLVAAVIAMMYVSASEQVGSARSALRTAQAAYAAVPAPHAASAVDSQLPHEEQTRVSAVATALGQRIDWDRILREVSEVVPSDVWLVSMNAQSPTLVTPITPGTVGTQPSGVVLTGCTYSEAGVARFLSRLDLVPDLASMTLGSSGSTSSAASGGASGTPGTSSGTGGGGCPQNMVSFTLKGDIRTVATS